MTQTTFGEDRLPPLPESAYSPAQRAAVEDFKAVRKTGLSGPWHAFVRSPEAFVPVQRLGEYLRYRCRFSGPLAELAILLIAREWSQDFEFAAHAKTGAAAGLSQETIEAVRDGRRLEALDEEAQIVVDFVIELLRRKSVSGRTWAQARDRFGEQGCVDLAAIVGYYGLLAAVMNAARTPPPAGEPRLPRFPD